LQLSINDGCFFIYDFLPNVILIALRKISHFVITQASEVIYNEDIHYCFDG